MLIDAVIVLMFVKKLFLIQRTKIEIIPLLVHDTFIRAFCDLICWTRLWILLKGLYLSSSRIAHFVFVLFTCTVRTFDRCARAWYLINLRTPRIFFKKYLKCITIFENDTLLKAHLGIAYISFMLSQTSISLIFLPKHPLHPQYCKRNSLPETKELIVITHLSNFPI